MKKKVILRRFFHRDKWRIAIVFDFDETLKAKVKSIPGSVYSSTHRCFYLDDSEENLKQVMKTMSESADIDISALVKKAGAPPDGPVQSDVVHSAARQAESASAQDGDKDFEQLPVTIRKVSNTGSEDDDIKATDEQIRYSPVEFRINEKEGLLVIKFLGRYDPDWVDELRTYGPLHFDKRKKEWLLPWSKMSVDSLADYFSNQGVKVNVTKQVINEALKSERKVTGDEIRSRPLGTKALDGLDMLTWYLDENRYSPRTRESYLAMLEFFFRYFSPKEPADIAEDEISKFLYDFIIRLGYSATYQNQIVSAIKIYYTIAGKGKVDPEFLERPRRRRSEVTNIRLTDLDRERNILHIREGKGMVDRFVPVPDKVWVKADEYMRAYKPREYLFEGQAGGRYSSESVYRVFKEALVKAGIKKDVGVHSLRHSYATHLHENGLDIRYIQELLGHKSSRTTEIYTHVSRRNLIAVRSPIDDLDVR